MLHLLRFFLTRFTISSLISLGTFFSLFVIAWRPKFSVICSKCSLDPAKSSTAHSLRISSRWGTSVWSACKPCSRSTPARSSKESWSCLRASSKTALWPWPWTKSTTWLSRPSDSSSRSWSTIETSSPTRTANTSTNWFTLRTGPWPKRPESSSTRGSSFLTKKPSPIFARRGGRNDARIRLSLEISFSSLSSPR